MDNATDFPAQFARTHRFALGVPRQFTVSADGSRVFFVRSASGSDPVSSLWVWEAGKERTLADPRLLTGVGGEVPAAERLRRERARERSEGVVSYSTDRRGHVAAFALRGALWAVRTDGSAPFPVSAAGPVVDPQLSPDGRWIGYVTAGALHVVELTSPASPATHESAHRMGGSTARKASQPPHSAAAPSSAGAPGPRQGGGTDRLLLAPEGPEVSYGLAEYVAAESMGRSRGFWWAPDSRALLVARVDVTPVQRWFIGDAANPLQRPRAVRYPSAGTANADVSLHVLPLDGERTEVRWDRAAFEYLVTAGWETAVGGVRPGAAGSPRGAAPAAGSPGAVRPRPVLTVQSRDQRTMRVLTADPDTGETRVLHERRDPAWVEIVPGIPARTTSGARVWPTETADTRGLRVAPIGTDATQTVANDDCSGSHSAGATMTVQVAQTPAGLQVEAVLGTDGERVLFAASEEPTERHVWSFAPGEGLRRISEGPGVHDAVCGGGTVVLDSRTLEGDAVTVLRDGAPVGRIDSYAEEPLLTPRPTFLQLGERELRSALYLPSWHTPGAQKLPVLVDPYGGPSIGLVRRCRGWWSCVSQWFAEQGFAVLVTDGRGTPGRGPAWEKAIHRDQLTFALDDQVDALHAAAADHPSLDLERVAIRGWSFGGFLAAAAVLHRPEVFHAAVAGAAPADQRLYDTHWKERFLGHPAEEPAAYDRSSLVGHAHLLRRPLLLVHGLADDNVVVAHTLRFSAELLAAGRPHTVLPLPGATHLPADHAVTENLLRFQANFLHQSLSG
ncbi:S9 family peptidase [Streptomyces zagrosensis]|uniref:Dipeptidyl-peptidase-4 n=1 Tax=Streptomyces zagrosensis TaxID=1042984 RepID=A0A7W9V269_9ACTN|nr:prolyl oligopeptidase family serine peptidase [Streptomyces zagrosensis]MBB5938534.1 dipeptidyl-peptidase-4 [Streptomyces zagrosensis]